MRQRRLAWLALVAALPIACRSTPPEPAADEPADFVVVLLKAGARRELPPGPLQDLMAAHAETLRRLNDDGELLVAGEITPPRADPDSRGILIFATGDVERARALASEDPAVQGDVLRVEAYPWRGPAALRRVPALERDERARRSPDAPLESWVHPYVMGTCPDAAAAESALAPLRDSGALVFFGTLGGDHDGSALFALDARDVRSATALLESAGATSLGCKLHPWFGPRALLDV